jgi:hypothetical protein
MKRGPAAKMKNRYWLTLGMIVLAASSIYRLRKARKSEVGQPLEITGKSTSKEQSQSEGQEKLPKRAAGEAGEDMIKDALNVTRNLHRLIITASLITLVFSLSLQSPDRIRRQEDVLRHFFQTDFTLYDRQTQGLVDKDAELWLKPAAEEFRIGLETTNYLVFGLNEIVEALKKPILMGQFKVAETKLNTPSDLTLKQLESFNDIFPLSGDLRVAVPRTTNLLARLQSFLAEKAKTGMRVQSLELKTSDNYALTEAPPAGETIKLLLSFELMPSGGPPSPWFQEVFDAEVLRSKTVRFSTGYYSIQNSPELPPWNPTKSSG